MLSLWFVRLDVGEGKEVNLQEQCSRSKLQEECIKYLGPVSTLLNNHTPMHICSLL